MRYNTFMQSKDCVTKGNIKMMTKKKTWESVQSCITRLPALNRLSLWTYTDTTTKRELDALPRADAALVCRAIKHGWYVIYINSYVLMCHTSTQVGILIEDGGIKRV